MKYIFTLMLILSANVLFSQIAYPRYETDSLGQKIVLMTVEQAQALDNNSDLLKLFENLDTELSDYDEVCLRVIGQKDAVIAAQDVQIKNLRDAAFNKDSIIVNLQVALSKTESKVQSLEREMLKKDDEIKLHRDELVRVKTNMWIGGSTSTLAIIGLIIGIIFVK